MNSEEYFGHAIFSIAVIDIKTFSETLNNLEVTLKDSEETLNLIKNLKKLNEDSISCLKEYPLTEFCKVQRYLAHIRNVIKKYQNRLVQYFLENPDKKEEFDLLLNELKNVVEDKQRFITKRIDECFECIQAFNNEKLIEN